MSTGTVGFMTVAGYHTFIADLALGVSTTMPGIFRPEYAIFFYPSLDIQGAPHRGISMPTFSDDGYIRLTLPRFYTLQFQQLMCIRDTDLLQDLWSEGVPAIQAGYYEGNLYQSVVKDVMRTESEENYRSNRYTGKFARGFAISLALRRRSVASVVPLPIRQAHRSRQSESSATGSAPRDV